MATTFIRVPQTGGAPEDYLVSGAADIDLLSVSADFDGSGAGVDWQPAVQILDEAGQVSATMVGSTVPAGGSASVTFAPFLRGQAGSTPPGAGIQFNVDNVGGWLEVEGGNSIPAGPLNPSSVGFLDNSGGGIGMWDGDNGGGITLISGLLAGFFFGASGINLRSTDGIDLFCRALTSIFSVGRLDLSSNNGVTIDPDATASGTQFLKILDLPIVNPGGTNNVWNNGGVLNIT